MLLDVRFAFLNQVKKIAAETLNIEEGYLVFPCENSRLHLHAVISREKHPACVQQFAALNKMQFIQDIFCGIK